MAAYRLTDYLMRATFTKAERLNSRKVIDQLFKKGSTDGKQNAARTFYLFPFRLLYLYPEPPPSDSSSLPAVHPTLPAILITVSKRNFKRAVDRNRIRRRIREAYRLNKNITFRYGRQAKNVTRLHYFYLYRQDRNFV